MRNSLWHLTKKRKMSKNIRISFTTVECRAIADQIIMRHTINPNTFIVPLAYPA